MLRLRDRSSLLRVEDPDLRRLIERRYAELVEDDTIDPDILGEWFLAEPGDTGEALEEASGVSLLTNPYAEVRYGHPEFVPVCDVLEEHATCYELVFILNDDGQGVTIFIPKSSGIDAELLSLCAAFAVPALTR